MHCESKSRSILISIVSFFAVPIEQMKEIRTGRHCESLRNKHFPPYYNEERIFSILYGSAYDSLDLIACTPGEANIWVSGLNALIGASQCKFIDLNAS